MRVLICHRPGGAFGFISDGWLNCLRDKGHEVRRWDGVESSWVRYAPELYIGCSGHKQPIPKDRNCKVAIHVNPYGPVMIQGINESAENIKWVVAQKPNAVFGYGQPEDSLLWSYWQTRHNIPWVPMPTAGDATIFKKQDGVRTLDIVYLGGYWAYKGTSIDAFLLPVIKDKQLNNKVYGWGDWPKGICGGMLPEDKVCDFFNSGKIGPCISEAHTHSHGIDIPERAFKIALCGVLVIHDSVPALTKMIPSAVICPTPEDMLKMCHHFANNEVERSELAEKQRQEVLQAHTYHHRISGLLNQLGFTEEARNMVQ